MAIENVYPPVIFGRPLKYTPDEIEEKFVEYVQWCKDNPFTIGHEKVTKSKRGEERSFDTEHRPRNISVEGFLNYIGASTRWWTELNGSKNADFSRVKARIREICRDYQLSMAYAGIYKENIVARVLGLADKSDQKQDVTHSVSEDTGKMLSKIPDALLQQVAEHIRDGKEGRD